MSEPIKRLRWLRFAHALFESATVNLNVSNAFFGWFSKNINTAYYVGKPAPFYQEWLERFWHKGEPSHSEAGPGLSSSFCWVELCLASIAADQLCVYLPAWRPLEGLRRQAGGTQSAVWSYGARHPNGSVMTHGPNSIIWTPRWFLTLICPIQLSFRFVQLNQVQTKSTLLFYLGIKSSTWQPTWDEYHPDAMDQQFLFVSRVAVICGFVPNQSRAYTTKGLCLAVPLEWPLKTHNLFMWPIHVYTWLASSVGVVLSDVSVYSKTLGERFQQAGMSPWMALFGRNQRLLWWILGYFLRSQGWPKHDTRPDLIWKLH